VRPSEIKPFTENRLIPAWTDLLGELDVNDDMEISPAEADAHDIRVMGWSFGGTSSITFTHELNQTTEKVAGFRLKKKVLFRDVVTFDPVNFLAFKRPSGPVETNVDSFHNYYEEAFPVPDFQPVDANGNVVGAKSSLKIAGDRLIKGGARDSNTPGTTQIRLDTDPQTRNVFETRDRIFANAPTAQLWRLPGSDTSHNTTVWYAYRRAKDDLGA
jgi:hypothetical protein